MGVQLSKNHAYTAVGSLPAVSNTDGSASQERKRDHTVLLPYGIYVLVAMQFLAIFALSVRVRGCGLELHHSSPDNLLYSPAKPHVQYETKKFNSAIQDVGHVSDYFGLPSPEVDAAWASLYDFGVTRIPKTEAAKMPNHTLPLYQDEGHYVVKLDVFHQLHCLDMVRRMLYPEYYISHSKGQDEQDQLLGEDHKEHCIESLRQSIMCHSDTSSVVFQWSAKKQRVLAHADVMHVCRNFEKLREWAMADTLDKLHEKVEMLDDLEIDVIY